MANKPKIILFVIASHSKLYNQYLEYWKRIILKKPANIDIYILLNDEKMDQPYKIDKSTNRIYLKHKKSLIIAFIGLVRLRSNSFSAIFEYGAAICNWSKLSSLAILFLSEIEP